MTTQTTYQWTISALDCAVSKDGLTNVVETIHWRYRGTNEDGITTETYGAQAVGDPNPEEFTPFADLTEEVVTLWLEEIMDMEEIKSNIETQINALENPTHVTLQLPSETVEPVEEITEETVTEETAEEIVTEESTEENTEEPT